MAKILVVDDDHDIAETLVEFLSDEGHEVSVCYLGEDALRLVPEQMPDVVFLDYLLPGRWGDEVAKELKRNPTTNGIPLILMSAGGARAMEIATQAGVAYFLAKPFFLEDVETALARVLARAA